MMHFTNDPANTVYAFEPTPHMNDVIKQRVGDKPNYKLIEKAVSNYALISR